MRHFLALSLSKVMLTPGVLEATGKRVLKALARGACALAARLAPARLGAIALPMVAALAEPQLLAAQRAIEDSVPGLDDGSTSSSQKPGQGPSIASLSVRDKNTSGRWMEHFPEGSRLSPRAFTFFRARLPYRATEPRETHAASDAATRRREVE